MAAYLMKFKILILTKKIGNFKFYFFKMFFIHQVAC